MYIGTRESIFHVHLNILYGACFSEFPGVNFSSSSFWRLPPYFNCPGSLHFEVRPLPTNWKASERLMACFTKSLKWFRNSYCDSSKSDYRRSQRACRIILEWPTEAHASSATMHREKIDFQFFTVHSCLSYLFRDAFFDLFRVSFVTTSLKATNLEFMYSRRY